MPCRPGCGDAAYQGHLARLPKLGRGVVERAHELGRGIGENLSIKRFAFVGSGSLIGMARESQLKIKEMVLLPSDSYPLLDYRHGPKSNVDESMLITVFTTDRTKSVEGEFIAEMKGLGGRLLVTATGAGPSSRRVWTMLPRWTRGCPILRATSCTCR